LAELARVEAERLAYE